MISSLFKRNTTLSNRSSSRKGRRWRSFSYQVSCKQIIDKGKLNDSALQWPASRGEEVYLFFFLWRFFLSRFLRLCVAILWRFLFLPQGICVQRFFLLTIIISNSFISKNWCVHLIPFESPDSWSAVLISHTIEWRMLCRPSAHTPLPNLIWLQGYRVDDQ